MIDLDTARATPTATGHDPQIDRLGGAIDANNHHAVAATVEGAGEIVGVDRWPDIRRWWATIEGWGVSRMADQERLALLHILGRAAKVPAIVPIVDQFLADLSGQVTKSGLDRGRRFRREMQKVLSVPGYEPPRLSASVDADIAAITGLVDAAGGPVSMLYLYGQFCRSVRKIPLTSFKKKLSLGSRPGSPIMKTGKRGLYGPPTAGGLPHASISRCIARVVPTAPPYAISWAPFRAALAPYGFTIKQIYGGLNQMRNVNGFLAPADRSLKGLVRWSADSIEKFQRGETLRDEFGAVVWSPDLSVVKANAEAPAEALRGEDLPARADQQPAPPMANAGGSGDDFTGYDVFRDLPLRDALIEFVGKKPSHEAFEQWLASRSESEQRDVLAYLREITA
jgi:hypothetical protein